MVLTRESLDIVIDRGNTLSFSLTFIDKLTDQELDMEVYAPFTAVVRHATRTTVLATFDVSADGGRLDFLLDAADTVDLELTGNVPHIWGVKDSQNTLWMRGGASVIGSPIEI